MYTELNKVSISIPIQMRREKTVKPSLWQRIILGWGKLRRFYLVYFRPTYVAYQLKRRRGECKRCGACCKLMFDCWFLKRNQPLATCRHYSLRSPACIIFPIDENDLLDRTIIRPDVECGYNFTSFDSAERE